MNVPPRTCVLYPPGFRERRIWRDRLAFADRHILNEGHGRSVDIGTFKVIICADGCLQVPGQIKKGGEGTERVDAVSLRSIEIQDPERRSDRAKSCFDILTEQTDC